MRKVLTDQEKGEQEEKGNKVATRLASSSHQLQLLPNLPTRETEQVHPQASPLMTLLTLLWTKTSRLLLARLTRIVEHFHSLLADTGLGWHPLAPLCVRELQLHHLATSERAARTRAQPPSCQPTKPNQTLQMGGHNLFSVEPNKLCHNLAHNHSENSIAIYVFSLWNCCIEFVCLLVTTNCIHILSSCVNGFTYLQRAMMHSCIVKFVLELLFVCLNPTIGFFVFCSA